MFPMSSIISLGFRTSRHVRRWILANNAKCIARVHSLAPRQRCAPMMRLFCRWSLLSANFYNWDLWMVILPYIWGLLPRWQHRSQWLDLDSSTLWLRFLYWTGPSAGRLSTSLGREAGPVPFYFAANSPSSKTILTLKMQQNQYTHMYVYIYIWMIYIYILYNMYVCMIFSICEKVRQPTDIKTGYETQVLELPAGNVRRATQASLRRHRERSKHGEIWSKNRFHPRHQCSQGLWNHWELWDPSCSSRLFAIGALRGTGHGLSLLGRTTAFAETLPGWECKHWFPTTTRAHALLL